MVNELEPDFIYITHLHWDHFHAPTLRRLGLNRHILVPRTPDRRIYRDLVDIGCTRVSELVHGRPFRIAPGFEITSYQFGHFPDSTLAIEADGQTILNANDCKMIGLPLRQLLRRHPKIDFLLRSHSSANARLCFEIVDRGGAHVDDPSKYSAEFADFARAIGATYAIPFASNNCYLHDETTKFNAYLNLGVYVKNYFEANNIKTPQCVVCAPGDGWDDERGFVISDKDWYTDIDRHLAEYKSAKASVIENTAKRDARARLRERTVARYAESLFAGTPRPVRRLFRGKPITLVAHSETGDCAFELDLHERRFRPLDSWNDADNPIQVHAHAAVFLLCINQRNWSSLGISKRVRFRVKEEDRKIITYFSELNDMFDCDVLPLSKSVNLRFAGVWMRRWRELLLYARIATNLALGKGFSYAKHLPRRRTEAGDVPAGGQPPVIRPLPARPQRAPARRAADAAPIS